MQNEERFCPIKEVAAILGVSVPLIRKKTRLGEIPVLRIGRRCVYPLNEILATLWKQQEKGKN